MRVLDEGNHTNVPIVYASPEKWKSIQKDGYMRDYNGKIQLPCIAFSRVSSEKDPSMQLFNRYLNYSVIKLYSQKNRYTPFNVLMGKNAPINEVYDVIIPDYLVFNYKFIIWTEYIEQMNQLVERLNFETGDYWGDLNGFRFRTNIESYEHTTELQTDQDRMVKTEFTLIVHGYLLPDTTYGLNGTKPTTQKVFTPKKVIINSEMVATDFNINGLDTNATNWKNKKYPNIDETVVIPEVPIILQGNIVEQPNTSVIPSYANFVEQPNNTYTWNLIDSAWKTLKFKW